MTDEFSFQSPFGAVGAVLDSLFLRRRMQTALDARARYLKGVAETDEWRAYLTEEVTA